jgi:hypothetical protein
MTMVYAYRTVLQARRRSLAIQHVFVSRAVYGHRYFLNAGCDRRLISVGVFVRLGKAMQDRVLTIGCVETYPVISRTESLQGMALIIAIVGLGEPIVGDTMQLRIRRGSDTHAHGMQHISSSSSSSSSSPSEMISDASVQLGTG